MFSVLLVAAVAVWFAVLCPVVLRQVGIASPVIDGPLRGPLALVVVFSFLPLVFNVPREDGSAVLEEGLSASNMLSVAFAGLTGLYLATRVLRDARLLRVPFAQPYLPLTLLLGLDALSTLWSIVPTYTAYRTVEVAIFSLASVLIFDRSDIERRLTDLLSIVTIAWLVVTLPDTLDSVSHGIVFSAAKNNMMPLVCAALLVLAVLQPGVARRRGKIALGALGFVIAGSAASTGALMAAVGPGLLIASQRPARRAVGWVLSVAAVLVFLVLMLGLSYFPLLLDIASTVMQKPAIELANGTGRDQFWPAFLAGTRDHIFGSGFSAADRFIQLLIPTDQLAEDLGRTAIHISSAHNMFLSAWAGTGVVGIGFCLVVLGTAIRWGLKLDLAGRRFVVIMVLMLVLNGMTTPGIFQDWTVNNLAFIALLAFARVGAMQRVRAPAAFRALSSARPRRVQVSSPRVAGRVP